MREQLDAFLKKFTYDDAKSSVEKVLIQAGYGDDIGFNYWDNWTYDFISGSFGTKNDYNYMNFHPLIAEMEEYISTFRDNDAMLKVYVSDILNQFDDIAEYFFPRSGYKKEYFEIAEKLHNLKDIKRPCERLFDHLSERADEEIEKEHDEDVFTHEEWERLKEERYTDLINEYDLDGSKDDLEIIQMIRIAMHRFATILEGLLLQYETKFDLFEYQEMCGVVILKEVRYYEFCNELRWSRGLAKYNLKRKYPCDSEYYCGVMIPGPDGMPVPINNDRVIIRPFEDIEESHPVQPTVSHAHLGEMIDQLCMALEKEQYVERSEDGVKWTFKAHYDLYAYMSYLISQKASYELVPWDYIMSRVQTSASKGYLKRLVTGFRKGKKPKSTVVIDSVFREMKF